MPEDDVLKTKADKEWLKLRTPMTAARYERKMGSMVREGKKHCDPNNHVRFHYVNSSRRKNFYHFQIGITVQIQSAGSTTRLDKGNNSS